MWAGSARRQEAPTAGHVYDGPRQNDFLAVPRFCVAYRLPEVSTALHPADEFRPAWTDPLNSPRCGSAEKLANALKQLTSASDVFGGTNGNVAVQNTEAPPYGFIEGGGQVCIARQ